jgi:hypothetical protein
MPGTNLDAPTGTNRIARVHDQVGDHALQLFGVGEDGGHRLELAD